MKWTKEELEEEVERYIANQICEFKRQLELVKGILCIDENQAKQLIEVYEATLREKKPNIVNKLMEAYKEVINNGK